MADNYEKIDDNTLKVTKVVPQTTVDLNYDYDMLIGRREELNNEISDLQIQLDNIDNLISQADSIGVKSKLSKGD